jgi:Protein of unknown function (DUF3348)
MLQASQRTALSGPALIRLLARLADVDVPESRQSLSDRLSQWLGWTDAIALSSALNGKPPAVAANARAFGRVEEDECLRMRSLLAKSIANDSVLSTAKRRAPGPMSASASVPAHAVAVDTPADYAVFRQRYLAQQQSMETAVGNLRGRLRGMLATRTPAMARLAVVDAVMERALGERERTLLATVPGLLAGHFERLREASQKAAAVVAEVGEVAEVADADRAKDAKDAKDAAPAAPAAPDAWLDVFRKDMQSVLLAELEVRLQPVEGLLAALRTC